MLRRKFLLTCALTGGILAFRQAWARVPRVVFCQDTTANDYRAAQVQALRQWVAKQAPSWQLVVRDAGGSVLRQMADLEWAIAHEATAIILGPRADAPLVPLVRAAQAQGIWVVGISRRLPGVTYDTFVHADNYRLGWLAADFLVQARPAGGKVAMLEGLPSASTAKERTAGFLERLRTAPQWQLVARAPADYLRHRAAIVMSGWLEAGTRFDALYAHSDSMLVGARAAMRQHGLDPAAVLSIGIDYTSAAQSAILMGEQTASLRYPLLVVEAAQAVRQWLLKGKAAAEIDVPSLLVTRDNAGREPPIF